MLPDFFMLDDDFRMITGSDGCFCPLHIAGFNHLSGKNYIAETIRDAIDCETPGLPCSFCKCA